MDNAEARLYLGSDAMKAAALVLAAVISTLASCASQIGYLAKQGDYLLRYSSGTQSIDDLIASPSTLPATRDFLLRIREIKGYAVQQVGLRDNANYTRYKSIDRDYLVEVVSACDAASFTPYQWSFPFLGRLPYKGFYEHSDAQAEAERLKKEGYDVIVRKVDAFSTLGFTKDPVYSFMSKYSPYELASTIIHEQTHATLWVKGQTDFNEELADFVGRDRGPGVDRGALRDAVRRISGSTRRKGRLGAFRGGPERACPLTGGSLRFPDPASLEARAQGPDTGRLSEEAR